MKLLPLPISAGDFNSLILADAFSLLPARMDTPEARVMLLAIALQESRLRHRWQVLSGGRKGPARGLLQFERMGGCHAVVHHAASRYWMHGVCEARGVAFNATAIWNAIENDDVLAAAAARLLLFTDPRKLPTLGDSREAWNLYIRTWRPGKPHRQTWDDLYTKALLTVSVTGDRR